MADRAVFIKLGVKDHEAVIAALRKVGKDGVDALQRIEGASKPASRSLTAFSATIAEVRAQATAAGSSLGPISAGLGALGGPLGVAALGVVGLGAGFIALTKNALSTADAIGDAADSLGISVKAYQQFSGAANLAGVSAEQFEGGIKILQDRLANAALKGGEAAAPFRTLGVAFQTASGEARSAEDVLHDLADAFKATTNPAERVRLALDLFGKAGAKFLPLFADGAQGMREFAAQAEALGLVIDARLVRDAGAANDKLDMMSRVVGMKLTQAFVQLAPQADRFASFVLQISTSEGAIEVIRGIAEAMSRLPGAVPGFWGLRGAGGIISYLVGDPADIDRLKKDLTDASTKLQTLKDVLADVDSGNLKGVDRGGLIDQIEKVGIEVGRLQKAIDALKAQPVSLPKIDVVAKPASALTKSEIDAIAKSYRDLKGAIDPVAKAQQEFADRVSVLMQATDAGHVTLEQASKDYRDLAAARDEAVRKAKEEASGQKILSELNADFNLRLQKGREEYDKRELSVKQYIETLEAKTVATKADGVEEKVLLAIREAESKLLDEMGQKTRELREEEKKRIRTSVEEGAAHEARQRAEVAAYETRQKAAEKFAADMEATVLRATDRVVDFGADAFFDLLEGRNKNLWDSFEQLGKRAFAQLASDCIGGAPAFGIKGVAS